MSRLRSVSGNWWILIGGVGLLALLLLAALGPSRPILMHDSAFGFLAWEDSARGGHYNCVQIPDARDISRDSAEFVTWWSPGQYVLVGLLTQLGITLGSAMPLAVFLGCICAGAGWYLCGRSIGLEVRLALWLAVVEVFCYHLLHGFGAFIGGELVVQMALPWFMLVTWKLRERSVIQLIALPFMLVAAAFLKLSFLMQMLGVPLFWAFEYGNGNAWQLRTLFLRTLSLGLVTLVGIGLWYWIFLSKGPTPASPAAPFPIFGAIGFCLLAPWLSVTGAGAIIGRYAFTHNLEIETFWAGSGWFTLPVGIAAGVMFGMALRRHPVPSIARLVAAVVLATVVPMSFLYVRGASVSLEDRHFYTAGAMLVVALVTAIPRLSARSATLGRVVLALTTLVAIGMALTRARSMRGNGPLSVHGYVQQQLTPEILARIHKLDQPQEPRSLFVMPSPEIALEVRHHRRWVMELNDHAQPGGRWLGRGPRLVVFERTYGKDTSGNLPDWCACFPDYVETAWKCERLDGWAVWLNDSRTGKDTPLTQ